MQKRNHLFKKVVSVVCLIAAVVTMSPTEVLQVNAEEIEAENQYEFVAELCQQDNFYELSVGDYVCAVGDLKDADGNILDSSEWEFCSYEEMKAAFDEMWAPLCYYSAYDEKDKSYEDAVAFSGQIPEAAFGKYVYYWLGARSHKDGTVIMDLFRSKYAVTAWDTKSNYTVEMNDDNKTVSVFSIWNGRSVSVTSTVKVNGKKYKINAVGSYALEENAKKELTTLSFSSGITSIGKEAFKGAGKLKSITINGNVTSVGKDAFAGINKKAVFKIKASKKNFDKIVKRIKKSGVPKTVTFKRVS
ncbi:MAG: leucine-rich repeat protein [Lachnospiraceae bacterium]|nr:leucine-rich repeat protein [Lachnospiraceae bacterium]MDY2698000.1 leucine-rich repeat protein [Lachnospiraceae bacterium]MDY5520670.1 leucine-rich repeat protein [Agathobacter sp.]